MTKTRITTTIEPDLLRALDGQLAGRGMTRSEAVVQAVEEWVEARIGEDRERVERVGSKIDAQAERLARMLQEARISSEIMIALFRTVSPAAKDVPREELRRRALAAMRDGRSRASGSQTRRRKE